jgi:hypothetical protein
MLVTLFFSGNSMNLTKIFKIIRQFFNYLSKIEGGDKFFSLYGRSFQLPLGRKNKNLQGRRAVICSIVALYNA